MGMVGQLYVRKKKKRVADFNDSYQALQAHADGTPDGKVVT